MRTARTALGPSIRPDHSVLCVDNDIVEEDDSTPEYSAAHQGHSVEVCQTRGLEDSRRTPRVSRLIIQKPFEIVTRLKT